MAAEDPKNVAKNAKLQTLYRLRPQGDDEKSVFSANQPSPRAKRLSQYVRSNAKLGNDLSAYLGNATLGQLYQNLNRAENELEKQKRADSRGKVRTREQIHRNDEKQLNIDAIKNAIKARKNTLRKGVMASKVSKSTRSAAKTNEKKSLLAQKAALLTQYKNDKAKSLNKTSYNTEARRIFHQKATNAYKQYKSIEAQLDAMVVHKTENEKDEANRKKCKKLLEKDKKEGHADRWWE